jgi:hypothetical protein
MKKVSRSEDCQVADSGFQVSDSGQCSLLSTALSRGCINSYITLV